MVKFTAWVAAFAALGLGSPALAEEGRKGDVQVRVLATGVLPDGAITEVKLDLVGLPAGTQTAANDNYVPTASISYFLTDTISIETICCVTQHDVDAVAGLPVGSELVSDALIVPATVTVKYHFDLGGVSPYVGAGPSYFLVLDAEPGAFTIPLGVDKFELEDSFGLALQAGLDVPLSDNGMVFSLDAKRYFISMDARWFADGTEVIRTEHKLDPWVVSAGIGFRF